MNEVDFMAEALASMTWTADEVSAWTGEDWKLNCQWFESMASQDDVAAMYRKEANA